ncbi:carboxy terminal-processing peptidase [Chitinophagaceae bacterium LB-8]|uniref:Carboxy terminal-processing peptidase n=1 Tax=Paraflavisolibacter caeni TaxID=2982496 RepID=A0A9X3BJ11_9BACT|nr:carboxy terminal-processing peptidase [Paraflavisolibacter caeni]MCU7552172.1 carboxy terminal-processing peptidase [Paraflavisolibacter caeni]
MKRLPLLLLMLAAGIFLTFSSMGKDKKDPPSKYERILRNVGEMLTQGHFSPKDINDNFSKEVFKKYLEELDPEKNILMQQDIQILKRHETRIDDEIKGAPVEFFIEAGKLFNQRIEEAAKIYKEILSKPFDFTVDEYIVTDSKKIEFPANDKQRYDSWRKRLKYMALERYVELQDLRAKNKGKDSFAVKTDADLEKEARSKVTKIMDRTFERYRYKFNDDDKFALYVNTITQMMDPYTEFFPPADKRYFDEQLSGEFYGIGASLQYDDGNIKINSLLTGSPAWKSGQIEVGDVIMKVAQGNEPPVELTGYVVEDAVKLIRGKKGSEVRLSLKKNDGTLKTVTLIREKIVQDETFARSAVVQQGTSKIGYIFLPEFYANFNDPNGSRSAVDVAKEVIKLKNAKVDGIVIDLRNNGGGSLYDVVQMAGLFIEDGPIVQVKDRENKPTVMRDKDGSVLYDGPLAVMVNEFSASASEIFAAAIQDYGRGVIIGSTSTYGKGTVQRSIGLDPDNFMATNSELGSLKLTLQKFYRINGGSTQLKGVIPDIVIPDQFEYLRFREKDNTNALPWDEVNKASYKSWNAGYDLQAIKNLSNNRLSNNETFKKIKSSTEWLAKQNDKEYPLNIDKFRKEQQSLKTTVQQLDTLLKLKDEMNVSYLPEDKERFTADKDRSERYNQWLKNLSKDIYLDQAMKVIGDITTQQNLAKTGGVKKQEGMKAF